MRVDRNWACLPKRGACRKGRAIDTRTITDAEARTTTRDADKERVCFEAEFTCSMKPGKPSVRRGKPFKRTQRGHYFVSFAARFAAFFSFRDFDGTFLADFLVFKPLLIVDPHHASG